MTINKILQVAGVLVALITFLFLKGDVKWFVVGGCGVSLAAHFYPWLTAKFSAAEAIAKKDLHIG